MNIKALETAIDITSKLRESENPGELGGKMEAHL